MSIFDVVKPSAATLNAKSVESLSNNPNKAKTFGGDNLTATELKAKFASMARYLGECIVKFVDKTKNGLAAENIGAYNDTEYTETFTMSGTKTFVLANKAGKISTITIVVAEETVEVEATLYSLSDTDSKTVVFIQNMTGDYTVTYFGYSNIQYLFNKLQATYASMKLLLDINEDTNESAIINAINAFETELKEAFEYNEGTSNYDLLDALKAFEAEIKEAFNYNEMTGIYELLDDFMTETEIGTKVTTDIATHNTADDSHQDIRDFAMGRQDGIVFEDQADLDAWLLSDTEYVVKKAEMYIGREIYLRDKDDPDYWVSSLPVTTLANLTELPIKTIDLTGYVPNTRTVNGKALSGDITLNADDIPYDETKTTKEAIDNKVATTTAILIGDGSGNAVDSGISTTDLLASVGSTNATGDFVTIDNTIDGYVDKLGIIANTSGGDGSAIVNVPTTFDIISENSDASESQTTSIELKNSNGDTVQPLGINSSIRDYISSDGVFNSNVGKVVLNGSEIWGTAGTYDDYLRFITSTLDTLVVTYSDALVDILDGKYIPFASAYEQGHFIVYGGTYRTSIMLEKTFCTANSITDVATFKTWLSTNNVTVHYQKATPTTETMSDTYIISMQRIKTYAEQTKLSSEVASGNSHIFDATELIVGDTKEYVVLKKDGVSQVPYTEYDMVYNPYTKQWLKQDIEKITKDISDLDTNKAEDSEVIKTTGDQNVAGVKAFSDSPIVPDATTSGQAVNKSQLDTKQNTLTFDDTPTSGSDNPVTSDGTKTAIITAIANVESGVIYDQVIRTQTDFETLIASPTWLDAKSVALIGQFTLSTTDNSGVKIPSTVMQIHGFNSAKITITKFKYDSSTAKGELWYDTLPTTPDYSIRDLEVDGTGAGAGYGFRNCTNLTNCTGTGTGAVGYGFRDCTRLTNCTGTGTGTSVGYGFLNCTNLTNCTGTGTGANGHGFRDCTRLTNCTGTGTGTTAGYGFYSITYASNCKDGGSSTDMWDGTNQNINVETCRKTLVNADNTTLNI